MGTSQGTDAPCNGMVAYSYVAKYRQSYSQPNANGMRRDDETVVESVL